MNNILLLIINYAFSAVENNTALYAYKSLPGTLYIPNDMKVKGDILWCEPKLTGNSELRSNAVVYECSLISKKLGPKQSLVLQISQKEFEEMNNDLKENGWEIISKTEAENLKHYKK